MSRRLADKNKPNLHENCVVAEKDHAKRKAKEVLKEVKSKRQPKTAYRIIDANLKAVYNCHSKEQKDRNVARLLTEDQNKKLIITRL